MFAVILSFLLFCTSAEADIYKYTDEDGNVLFTNTPVGKKNEKITKDKKIRESSLKKTEITSPVIKANHSYSPIVDKKAKQHDVDPSLVNAVIKTESNWNHRAVSKKGAMGLMQLMPSTANNLNVKNPFDPEDNIDGGTRYLKHLIERFNGNLTLALAAYNAGPRTVEQYGAVPPISETKLYVKKVLSLYNGKYDYVSGAANKSEPIYKIVTEDGTILFTNFPLYKKSSSRF